MKKGIGSTAVRQIDVTVRPRSGPVNGHVPCRITGDAHHGVIFLDYGQAYDITFTLDPDHGVTQWSAAPFGNQEGACPPVGQGPTGNFSLEPGTTATSMTVHVAPIAPRPDQRVEKYRLNFNGNQTSDPIIIIGAG